MGVILAVRIKGSVGMDPDVRKTLESLKLEKAYMAGLFPDNPSIIGMLKKVSRYLTWGRPSKQTLAAFFSKAGMPADDQHVEAILRGEKSLDRTVIIPRTSLSVVGATFEALKQTSKVILPDLNGSHPRS
jgi:large subunit ribosomal protein L30